MFARLLTVALVASTLINAQLAVAAPTTVPSVTDPRYWVGANVPWYNWGTDFGGGAKNGVSSPSVKSSVSDGFGRLQSAGVHTVRWWTFEGDASLQITRDASGAPTGLNPAVYTDFDAALALADRYDLAYDFVLFSGPTAVPGGWFTDPTQRQRLADVLAPLFERYRNNPHILAWEIVNEPEFDIWSNKISQADVQTTVKLLANTVHAHTQTAVTIGSANLEGMLMWESTDASLDFYSPHWYDPMNSGLACARCTDVPTITAAYKLDSKPIVLGEFYASPNVDALQRLKDFRAKGYAGAWAWSLFSDKTGDKFAIDLAAVTAYTSNPSPAPAAAQQPPLTAELLANWVSPVYAVPGQQVTISQDVTTSRDANVLVDFEILDSNGQRVWQNALDNQALSGGVVTSFTSTFTVPTSLPPGTYSVKTGLFTPGWGTLYSWSDQAGSFVIDSAPATGSAADQTSTDTTSTQDDTSAAN
ncbi:MAG: cellulase family glycosylhydrolase [Chloroflexi bacterium]|nr:cellulase family glycosylhydrolase [Chloroflexota bacterium]